ncbi:MAG: hypothetical protein IIW54_02590, partial [Lachnospiraceae bacterium]|nr:hypothetical protein [Lachnospiraceae bacterium]
SQALNLLKQRGYIIKDDIPASTSLGVVSIFLFQTSFLGGLFAMPFYFWETSTILFQTFYLPNLFFF